MTRHNLSCDKTMLDRVALAIKSTPRHAGCHNPADSVSQDRQTENGN
jgi:hypothetical protein